MKRFVREYINARVLILDRDCLLKKYRNHELLSIRNIHQFKKSTQERFKFNSIIIFQDRLSNGNNSAKCIIIKPEDLIPI